MAVIRVQVTKTTDIFASERRVIGEIGGVRSQVLTLSVGQSEQTVRIHWLDEFAEPLTETVVRLIDADTGQVLEERLVGVALVI